MKPLGPEQEYLLTVQRDFVTAMRESQFYLGEKGTAKPLDLDWSRFPREIRPGGLRKKVKDKKLVKPNLIKRKQADIDKKLDDLGKLEDKDDKSDNESDKDETEDKKRNSEDEVNDDEGSDVEPDEEMDGGTDYANNFFDNGEGFLDEEEDNLEDNLLFTLTSISPLLTCAEHARLGPHPVHVAAPVHVNHG